MNLIQSQLVTSPNPRRHKGFSLFELTAFIIITAIIYSVAVNRFSEFPEAAERANFIAIINQIQTGINLELMLGLNSGNIRNLREFDGINPMDLLLEPPSNYLGEFGIGDTSGFERRTWYFDSRTSELVYLVNSPDNVFLVDNGREIPTSEVRFKVVALYRYPDSRERLTLDEIESRIREEMLVGSVNESQLQQNLGRARPSGALLKPTLPFRWQGSEIDVGAEIEGLRS